MAQLTPGDVFRDNAHGPEMVVVPDGKFQMGDPAGGVNTSPVHEVVFEAPFAVSRFPITFDNWDAGHAAGGLSYKPHDRPLYPDFGTPEWGRGKRPVINVSWFDALDYVSWLSDISGKHYRLLSEAEWEYIARASTDTRFWWGDQIDAELANLSFNQNVDEQKTTPVDQYSENPFGVYDVIGNVWEWVQDSRNLFTYWGAPLDGSAWQNSEQAFRILRGGSWSDDHTKISISSRKWSTAGYRYDGGTLGFRVARDLGASEIGKSIIELKRPLYEQDITAETQTFRSLQGGILSGHGRSFANLILLRFVGTQTPGRTALEWAAENVTSAHEQFAQAKSYRLQKILDTSFVSFSVSASGYYALGHDLTKFDTTFADGMIKAGTRLNDPPVAELEPEYQLDCHAIVQIASEDRKKLRQLRESLIAQLSQDTEVICVEHGNVIRDSDGRSTDWFGYADGISQPKFTNRLPESHSSSGTSWNDLSTVGLVLVKDPLVENPNALGSYLVYRKLEQDLDGFDTAKKSLGIKLRGDDPEELAGALMFGRFKDGTPVTLSARPFSASSSINIFDYADDPSGTKCPFQSHVRKMNPRGEHLGTDEKSLRIVRRGIPYSTDFNLGTDTVPRSDVDDQIGRGLLFMCYQADIESQFEFLQSRWANDPAFMFGFNPGVDPIAGHTPPSRNGDYDPTYPDPPPSGHRWYTEWGEEGSNVFEHEVEPLVALKGGEYFFTPSIDWLTSFKKQSDD